MDSLIRRYKEEMAALEKKKDEIVQMRNEIARQMELMQQAEVQKRAEMLVRIVEDGVRLGMSISKPGYEKQWVDITESAIKLILDLQRRS
jgi:HSP20 family molecular chaperone IbpA